MEIIIYKEVEIMIGDGSFFNVGVLDEEFDTIAEAKQFIDSGCPMSEELINVYRHGGF